MWFYGWPDKNIRQTKDISAITDWPFNPTFDCKDLVEDLAT